MERAQREVIGRTMPRAFCQGLLLLTGLLGAMPGSRGGTNWLVIERVDRLTIYNKYQQEATPQDRSVVLPFVPMKILNEDGLLSDGYTRCMQVEIGGTVFYLLKDQNARLAHSGDPGFEQTFVTAEATNDTVEILGNHSLSFSLIKSRQEHSLHAGERVVRFFLHRNTAYCQILDGAPAYGWIDFRGAREGRDWKIFTSPVARSTVIPDQVVEKIRTRVTEVNNVFMKLFDHFNMQTHRQKEAPRWDLEVSATSVLCVLQGPDNPDQFQQSTLYLAKDIENFTLGAELLVSHSPGRIEVTTRGGR